MAKLIDLNAVIVTAALDILSQPKHFLKGAWAAAKKGRDNSPAFDDPLKTTKGGNFIKANDPNACSWCVEGAIMKACGDLGFDSLKAGDVINAVNGNLPGNRGIRTINDSNGRVAVVAALRKALAILKKKAKVASC